VRDTHDDVIMTLLVNHRLLGRGAFGEVWAGTALDIVGPGTGLHPVALKV